MYESDDICQYLRETYGPAQDAYDPKALWPLPFGPFQLITSTLAAIVRGLPGGQRRADARAGNEERKPLELWGYETSPIVRPVRETLCALTLPHVMAPCCVEIKLLRRLLDALAALVDFHTGTVRARQSEPGQNDKRTGPLPGPVPPGPEHGRRALRERGDRRLPQRRLHRISTDTILPPCEH